MCDYLVFETYIDSFSPKSPLKRFVFSSACTGMVGQLSNAPASPTIIRLAGVGPVVEIVCIREKHQLKSVIEVLSLHYCDYCHMCIHIWVGYNMARYLNTVKRAMYI